MKLENKWNFLLTSNERKSLIPDFPRRSQAKEYALEYLNYKHISTLPIDFTDCSDMLFNEYEWIVMTYEEAKKHLNVIDPLNLKKQNALARTFHFRDSKTFLTVYIETINIPRKDYYTVAHELGHIVLGHFFEFEDTSLCRGGLQRNEYKVLEREAEIFAAELIMPMPVLKNLSINSYKDIINICKVTKSSSEIRFNEMLQFVLPNYSPLLTKYKMTEMLFQDFINEKSQDSLCEFENKNDLYGDFFNLNVKEVSNLGEHVFENNYKKNKIVSKKVLSGYKHIDDIIIQKLYTSELIKIAFILRYDSDILLPSNSSYFNIVKCSFSPNSPMDIIVKINELRNNNYDIIAILEDNLLIDTFNNLDVAKTAINLNEIFVTIGPCKNTLLASISDISFVSILEFIKYINKVRAKYKRSDEKAEQLISENNKLKEKNKKMTHAIIIMMVILLLIILATKKINIHLP